MRISDIQFQIKQKEAELEEKKWWRDHFIARRSELRKRPRRCSAATTST